MSNTKGISLLSVILPTYNRAYCISGMIDTVLMQNFGDFELIVIDDGSTDGTIEMLQARYNDRRMRIVRKENGGVSSARNLGILLAKGEYITFVDSDDYLLDGFFKETYKNILETSADVYIYSGLSKEKGRLTLAPLFWGDWGYGDRGVVSNMGCDFVKDFCLFGGNSWACAKVFKTSLIRDNNLAFEESISYGEDMLFNLQAYLKSSSVIAISRGYYVYNISKKGLSRRCLSSKRKVLDLLCAYKMLEENVEYRSYFALNYIRHIRRWFLLSFFSHGLEVKKQVMELYLQIKSVQCHPIEGVEIVVAKKSLLCALFAYKVLYILWEIRSRLRFFIFLVKTPFRMLKKTLKG